jgi:hypothetical protein
LKKKQFVASGAAIATFAAIITAALVHRSGAGHCRPAHRSDLQLLEIKHWLTAILEPRERV